MAAVDAPVATARSARPFDLDHEAAYQRWRAAKLATRAHGADELIVEVADPAVLSRAERDALLQRCARCNMALYRCASGGGDKASAIAIAAQLGLHRLDANWLADEDGVSSITVSRLMPPTALRAGPPEGERAAWGGPAPHAPTALRAAPPERERAPGGGPETRGGDERGGFIPYTDRAIRWHTDGYYHPEGRLIRAMVLHCVRPAREGGVSGLLDHELAYIALRDALPQGLRALMAADAMTIPGREDDTGVARAAQSGPVFSVDPRDGALHMRYTARTRSIVWKDDPATRQAVAFLERFLSDDNPFVLRLRLEAGMGIVANNVLHDRSGFTDDPAAPRLLYRARYLDRTPTLPAGHCPPRGPLLRTGGAGSAQDLGYVGSPWPIG